MKAPGSPCSRRPPGAAAGAGSFGAGPPRQLARLAASSGFTLVELLVALFILALLAGLSWRGVDGIVRTRDASQERLERQLRLQSVIGQWETDLAELQDTGSVVPLRFDGASLRLTRRVAGGVQVVVWTLRDGAWTRWSGPAATTVQDLQESWLSSQQLLGNEPGNLKALQGIEGWQLYYWRKNGWTNAQSSGDVAEDGAAVAREQLPGGVRLQLGLGEGSGFAGTLIRDVQLAPQPSTAQGPA